MLEVYGASDDLIEVEGDVREEFSYNDDNREGDLLALSDGTVLRIRYSAEGVWRITKVATGRFPVEIVQAPEGDDDNYSDRATVHGDVEWVVHGIDYAKVGASL